MIGAEVFLWGSRIGVVTQESVSAIPRFNFDKDFLRSGIEVSPLVMPLSERVYSFPALNPESFRGLPGLLADSLPDKFGTRLIERYLAGQGRRLSDFSSVERLCYIGNRGMGALEYVPALYHDAPGAAVDVDALVKLASDILTERKDFHANSSAMDQIIRVGTSAGGARAKAVIAWNEETGDICSGQIDAGSGYGYWIIKFDGVSGNRDRQDKDDGAEYTRIEYAYYLMAKAAGIEMSECRQFKENGRTHFLTRRFDRNPLTGDKIHMQSLGGVAHYDYNSPGECSYEQVADVIYRLGMGQREIAELYRRMCFNVLAVNCDDHVKNIAFLMDRRGMWSLSPAYDLTFAYDESNFWLRGHQISVNGKTEDVTKEDLLETAKNMNISLYKARLILNEVQSAIGGWRSFAEEAGVSERTADAIGRFLDEMAASMVE